MNNIKAVFFDAGMTLLHPHPAVEEVCMSVCERMGLPVEFDAICQGITAAWGFFYQCLREDNQLFSSDTAIKAMWEGYYFRALEVAKVSSNPRVLKHCAEAVYEEYVDIERWAPFPETEDTLLQLKEKGYVQGVISDWGTNLRPILHQLDLTKYLDFVVGSADVGAAKPNNHVFDLALKRAAVKPEQALHVGDSYGTDVLGARGANITPVLLDRSRKCQSIDCIVIGSLDELIPLVGK